VAEKKQEDGGGGKGMAVLKGVLMGLGGLVALGIVVSVLKPLLVVGIVGGAGYLGYRLMKKKQALPAGNRAGGRKALTAGSRDDFDRRMRELEEVERRLDSEIGKG
jgi:hypothetical protein